MTTSESKGRFFLTKRIDSNRELECSTRRPYIRTIVLAARAYISDITSIVISIIDWTTAMTAYCSDDSCTTLSCSHLHSTVLYIAASLFISDIALRYTETHANHQMKPWHDIYRVAQKLHISICSTLNWYRNVKSLPNFKLFGRLVNFEQYSFVFDIT